MQMLVLVWRILIKVLRHFGWGILLVPVAAMSIALFGLSLWTLAAVVLATVVAVQWPAAAARALPPTMVGAGVSGLVVAGRISGSPVSWFVKSISAPFAARKLGALPPGVPASPRWITMTPTGGMQVTFSPRGVQSWVINAPAAVAKRLPGGGKTVGAKRIFLPKQVLAPQKLIPKQLVPVDATLKGAPPPGVKVFPGPPAALAKMAHVAGKPPWAVQAPPAGLWHGRLLVPLALLLLTLGLWLTPRTLAGLRGRGAILAPEVRRWLVANRWGVLLVPVTLIGLTVFGVHPWTIAAVIAGVIVLARWPRVAADLVPVVLAIFAIRGFQLAANWQSMAAAFQGPAFNQPPAGPGVEYGALFVNSPGTALLAGAQASVFLAFGAWLVPRTIGTHVRTATPGTEVELAGRVQRLTESRSHAVDAATSELRRIERD